MAAVPTPHSNAGSRLARCRAETLKRTRRTLLTTPAEGYAACCEAIASHDLRAELRSIRAPTLVIAADDDPATPAEHGRLIGRPSTARAPLLARARHRIAVERPEEFARQLIGHLTVGAVA